MLSLNTTRQRDPRLLSLFLRKHSGGPPGLMEYLTHRDLVQLKCVSKTLRAQLQEGVEYTKCPDLQGREYNVPFPGFPGLFCTKDDIKRQAGLYPHQLASLAAMNSMENPIDSSFGVLRGGILGDAPGLGKTITALALIASTAGTRPVLQSPLISSHEDAIADGWTALRTNPQFNGDLRKTLSHVRFWASTSQTSLEAKDAISDLDRKIMLPFRDGLYATHQDFRLAVLRDLRLAGVPTSELELFKWKFDRFKESLDRKSRSFYKSKEIDPRFQLERSLVPSTATLVIVPDAMLEHWFQQIHSHLLLDYFADGNSSLNGEIPRGIVFLDGIGDIADAKARGLGNLNLNQDMAPPEELSGYMIIVSTFSRCEQEFHLEQKSGRFRDLRRKNSNGDSKTGNKRMKLSRLSDGDTDGHAVAPDSAPKSSLLRIRWLRLMVDEGHGLGAHDASDHGLTHIIHDIAAERRWVLSGTPTTGDKDSKEYKSECLDQIQCLLSFLRHSQYGAVPPSEENDSDSLDLDSQQDLAYRMWEVNVKDPFLHGDERGRAELLRVLKSMMVMHQKEDIDLPQPVFLQGEVEVPVPLAWQEEIVRAPSAQEAQQRLDRYMATNAYQSLVDEAQADYIVRSIQEARENVRQLPANARAADRRQVKAVVYSSLESNVNLLSVAEQLYQRLERENIAETSDTGNDTTKELSRFRNGVKNVATCPICGCVSDVDPNGRPRCSRTLMEVKEAPGDGRFLIEPERIVNVFPRRVTIPAVTAEQYRQDRRQWRVGDGFIIDVRDPHPILSTRESEETWNACGSSKCQELAEQERHMGRDWYFGPLPLTDDNLMSVRLHKFAPCSAFHNPNRWYKGPLLADVPVSEMEEDVFLLCLSSILSRGLDLSFVTHLFLLEPIDDAATLEQVTSRAHRLGATGPVIVETVNAWRGIDEETKRAISDQASGRSRNKDSSVCQFCFRSFESLAVAEEHEAACPRNKNSNVESDCFDLASLYREIRPPPPLDSITMEMQTEHEA